MEKIAVESTLSSVKLQLQQKGYEVVDLEATQQNYIPGISCCVISGQDKDVMGITDKIMDVPLVNIHGMNSNEAVTQIEQKVKQFAAAQR